MSDFSVDTVIIGAGVIGLAIGKELAFNNKNVLILEAEDNFGKLTSSRNSGVIHAGIYYPTNSLKSKFCVSGNSLLYDYCIKNHISFKKTKKIVIASSFDQVSILDKIKIQAEENGVENITKITSKEVSKIEPLIQCQEALLVPSTGIIDTIGFMRSLIGKIEDNGGMIAYKSKVSEIHYNSNKFHLVIKNENPVTIECNKLINSAGLFATNIASKIKEMEQDLIPKIFYAKGNYFSSSKKIGINHLIYPAPDGFVHGIHLTLELDNSVKFGPDLEWVDSPLNYNVNASRKKIFAMEIQKYIPSFKENFLQPSYSGIRPIINKKDKSMKDFLIQTKEVHTIPNLVNLYGIDSPGLTSSLAIAKHIKELFI